MVTVVLLILLAMAVGSLPTWPHSREWGYYPTGGFTLLLVVLVLLMLAGRV